MLGTILCLLCATSALAQSTVTSLSDGSFIDASTWDCNCIPDDSMIIVIDHSITVPDPLEFIHVFLWVKPDGEWIGSQDSSDLRLIDSGLKIEGYLGSLDIYIDADTDTVDSEVSGFMEIYDDLYTVGDTLYVEGLLEVHDSVFVAQPMKVMPTGDLHCSELIVPAFIQNLGNVLVDNALTGMILNFGVITVNGSARPRLFNYGRLNVGGDLRIGSFLGNFGSMHVGGDVIVQGPFGMSIAELLMSEDTALVTIARDLVVHDLLTGIGQVCVAGNSSNFGDVVGAMDICDLTPQPTPTGFDVNTGYIANAITFCQDTTCSVLMDVEDTRDPGSWRIFPVPSDGSFLIRGVPAGAIYNIRDAVGVMIQHGRIESDPTTIELPHTTSGSYFIQLERGAMRRTLPLIIQR